MAFDANMLACDSWFYHRSYFDWCVRQLATLKRPVAIAEVGCWKGHGTAYLMRALIAAGIPFVLHAVDLWSEEYFHSGHSQLEPEVLATLGEDALYRMFCENVAFAAAEPLADLVKHREDSATAARHVNHGTLDMCFIDAGHGYDSVMRDIVAWYPKMREGGIMAGHDYWERDTGVVRAVDESFRYVARFDGLVWQAMGLVLK